MTQLLLVAAALVAVLAAAGAEWDVYPGAGTPIQDAIDGAGDGDVDKRLTLIDEGADVCGC